MYLKSTGEAYAVTSSKYERGLFLSQRNPDCFEVKSIKLSKAIPEATLMKFYASKILREYPVELELDGEYVMFLLTRQEEQIIEQVGDALMSIMGELGSELVKQKENEGSIVILDDDYKEAVKYLMTSTMKKDNGIKSTIDIYALVQVLLCYTFNPSLVPRDLYNLEGHDSLIQILEEYCPSLNLLGIQK